MPITAISDKLSVSPQLSVEDIPSLRDKGFKTLINNRPDNEDTSQPNTQAERQEAKHCGLTYAFVPVTADTITEAPEQAHPTHRPCAGKHARPALSDRQAFLKPLPDW